MGAPRPRVPCRWRIPVKAVLGSVTFLVSLFLMRQILVGTGLMPPNVALIFLVAAVGIPLGGIVFLEAAFDGEQRAIRRELQELREEVSKLRHHRLPSAPETKTEAARKDSARR